MKNTIAISRTTKAPLPSLPFQKIKNDILGSQYVVSLVFVGTARARALNIKNRKKSYVPNVLSFPIEKDLGEVYITPKIVAREARDFNLTPRGYTGFLFIHALLHLKGEDHGATMEKHEAQYMKKYRLS